MEEKEKWMKRRDMKLSNVGDVYWICRVKIVE